MKISIKRVILIFFSISIFYTAGCLDSDFGFTKKPVKEKVCPDVPIGPKFSAKESVNLAMEQLSKYNDKTFLLPFTLTTGNFGLFGGTCYWDGNNTGNCSNWEITIEGIYIENDTHNQIIYAGDIGYEVNDTGISDTISYPTIYHHLLTINETNEIINEINVTRLDIFLTNDSYQIYSLVEGIRGSLQNGTCIQGMGLKLKRSELKYNREPYWLIAWDYWCKEGQHQCEYPTDLIEISAIDGQVLFKEPT